MAISLLKSWDEAGFIKMLSVKCLCCIWSFGDYDMI